MDLLQELTDIDTLNESEDEANILVDALVRFLLAFLFNHPIVVGTKQRENHFTIVALCVTFCFEKS